MSFYGQAFLAIIMIVEANVFSLSSILAIIMIAEAKVMSTQ